MLATLCLLAATVSCCLVGAFPPSQVYSNFVQLDTNGKVRMYWNSSGYSDNDTITIELHVETLGWVGVGFSPNGGMAGADMVVAGSLNGQGYVYDRNAKYNGFPPMDKQQDYELLLAVENGTHTVVKLRRKLNTCDPEDFQITDDTIRVIWAYSTEDATSPDNFAKHKFQQNGVKSLLLLSNNDLLKTNIVPNNARTIEILVNDVKLSRSQETVYWCKVMKLPAMDTKQHLIKYEPIIPAGAEAFVHHIVIYHCLYNMSQFEGSEGECFNTHGYGVDFPATMYCSNRWLTVWAVGGDATVFPADLGVPLFEPGQSPFIKVEIHLDNSNYQEATVSSGMRLYFAPEMRPIEVGSLLIGTDVGPQLMIPPRQKRFTTYAFCTPNCTARFPKGGIKVIGSFLHEHVLGVALKLRHIRNGVELPPIAADDHYDFNYQQRRAHKVYTTVLPNDVLLLECTFDSERRTNTTFGGFTTHDEMCFAFIEYFPRMKNLFNCAASPLEETYGEVMGAKFVGKNDKYRAVFDDNGKNVTLKQLASQYNFGDTKLPNGNTLQGEQFQKQMAAGNFYSACIGAQYKDETTEATTVATGTGKEPEQIEKMSIEYSPSVKVPFPAVPYVVQNLCGLAPSGFSDTIRPVVTNPVPSGYVSDSYINTVTLDTEGRYNLSWKFDNATITFEVSVQTAGWIGLGFSPNGGMGNADMMVAWVDYNNVVHMTDRHADSNGFPPLDKHQDYIVVSSMKNSTHTVIVFKRPLNTCDKEDWKITEDTTRVIWAFGNDMPTGDDSFRKHPSGQRGTKSLHLLAPPKPKSVELPKDTVPMDFNVQNIPIPSDSHTLYWCHLFKLPKTEKKYLVRIEPLITKGNEAVVHHMILYGCRGKDLDRYINKGEICKDPSEQQVSESLKCRDLFFAGWAVGGEPLQFQSDMGMAYFGDGADTYALLEMHYDNSAYRSNIVDSSGFRLFFTPTPRPVEIDTITMGHNVDIAHMIPPGQAEFTTYSYCRPSCTQHIASGGVNVFMGFLHTHLTGRKIRVRLIRDGVEQPAVLDDEFYDFNYQNVRQRSTPIKILPNDTLITECVYNTQDRTESTVGGESTRNEMCLVFLYYYPKAPGMILCMDSLNSGALLKVLGARDTVESDFTDGVTKLESEAQAVYNGKVVKRDEFITKYNWTSSEVKRKAADVQAVVRDGLHDSFCVWTSNNPSEVMNAVHSLGLDMYSEEGKHLIEAKMAVSIGNATGFPEIRRPLVKLNECGGGYDATADRQPFGRRDSGGETDPPKSHASTIHTATLLIFLALYLM